MNPKAEIIYTESYALFLNVDESILKLNPIIFKLGFKFINCTLAEFEDKFSLLFLSEKSSKQKGVVMFKHKDELSQEFQAVLIKQSYGSHIISKGEVFLLQRLETQSFEMVGKQVSPERESTLIADTHKISHNILRTLRLCASGDAALVFDVLLSKGNKKPLSRSWSHKNYGSNISTISDNEVIEFEKIYPAEPATLDYLRLAEENYFLAYETSNLKLKYILLMTSLESLFNFSRYQIAHTISRHLSLVLLSNESEFGKNYNRNRELYKLRNTIVHGNEINENITTACYE